MKSQEGSPDAGGPPGNPSVRADTDDRILSETNVPIRQFIPHILYHTTTGLICICPFIFFPHHLLLLSLSLSLSLSSLLFRLVNLFISTQGLLVADRQLMCSVAPHWEGQLVPHINCLFQVTDFPIG